MPTPSHRRLLAEFLALYVAAPAMLAILLPPEALFPALFATTALGIALLAATPGFHWAELARGARRGISWRLVALFLALTGLTAALVVAASPDGVFLLHRERPGLLALIVVLYPILSALPQELVFRPLFFRRYGALLPEGAAGQIVLNAGLFAYAHLMYWSWLVLAMTFCGGLFFAYAYRVRGSFAQAVLLHSLAGIVVFAAGLGTFFYSGNVTRPF